MRIGCLSALQALVLLFAAVIFACFFSTVYVSNLVYPELGMVAMSDCSDPLRDWDGKIFRIPIWRNALQSPARRNASVYADLGVEEGPVPWSADRPVILWGAHHKAGTYLAQKIFALICQHKQWCCVFGNTRDSKAALVHALRSEPVRVLGHNQWAWLPEELLPRGTYRFVHFYRHPYKKILSGYRFHREASESWCKHPQHYSRACVPPDNYSRLSHAAVRAYCRSVHLCQTCCAREHELGAEYMPRPPHEYAYLCRHLGTINGSLTEALLATPPERGALQEAALEYFESLRMARILNHTWMDPHTLNVDIDVMKSDFAGAVSAIVQHLGIAASSAEVRAIAGELAFFDYGSSPLYRWSISNPLFRHISVDSAPSGDKPGADEKRLLMDALRSDNETSAMYRPVLELMATALAGSTADAAPRAGYSTR